MQQKVTRRMFLMLLIFILVVVTACSGNNAAEELPSSAAPSTEVATSTASASAEENIEPLGKYDPPITLSTVKILCDCSKFAPGETAEKNIWTEGYLNDLGIDMRINWSIIGNQPGGAGEQKLNVSIAANDLPDIIPVGAKQLKQLVDAGLTEDLTDAFDKYASPQLKKIFENNNGLALKTATFGGKLMAIPDPQASIDAASMIWVRKDWLDKLSLPEPKTMADILTIMDAFTNKDPDGNNKKDTYGISLGKDLYGTGQYDLNGFFEGYHAYNNIWIKDASGKLAYGSIQPEMKTALGQLQMMFKAGQIDPEFGVKDNSKVNETVVASKIGIIYGQHWIPYTPIPDNVKLDPKAVWKPYPIVSADSNPAIPAVGIGVNKNSVDQGYFVFKKGSKHPEAIVKLANYYVDKEYGFTTGGYNGDFHSTKEGDVRWVYAAVIVADPNQNMDIYRGVKANIENGDQEVLKNLNVKSHTSAIKDYIATKNPDNLVANLWVGPTDSAFDVLQSYLDQKLTISNEFYGSDTPTMIQKKATLDKLQLETFTKIITGGSLDSFDQFVNDWKKLGGEAMTNEVNEWYAAQQ